MALQGLQLQEHVLNRLGYGQSLWHTNRFEELGLDGYIEEQLNQTLEWSPSLVASTGFFARRCTDSRRQLEAVLASFWFNHFNVDRGALPNNMMHAHVAEVIEPNVLSPFGDLLLAVAKSPAMLEYLDNQRSRDVAPVDNYARELMELHTIGVDGGYTESDVADVARILTGWRHVQTEDEFGQRAYKFAFDIGFHDTGAKTVLGVDFPAGGQMEEGEQLLAILAEHPSAASFLAHKLCVRFVSESPSASLVASLASEYSNSGGSIASVLAVLFASDDFVDDSAFRSKAKSPYRWYASAIQAMGATYQSPFDNEGGDEVKALLIDAGEHPYNYPPPNGFPDSAAFWVSPISLTKRFAAAQIVAGYFYPWLSGRTGVDASDPVAAVDAAAAAMLPGGISDATRSAVLNHLATQPDLDIAQRLVAIASLLLTSPEFMRH